MKFLATKTSAINTINLERRQSLKTTVVVAAAFLDSQASLEAVKSQVVLKRESPSSILSKLHYRKYIAVRQLKLQ